MKFFSMKKEKVLIIKTGYSEVLDGQQESRITSLGDVLRTTPLLHKYKDCHITWVTSEEVIPLLINNPHIDRILPFDLITIQQLESEEFDRVINLEKVPGICALADKIRARRNRYGFTFNSQIGEAEALDHAYDVLSVAFDTENKKNNKKTFQELLFEMIGEKFEGEESILGYQPNSRENIYDIGFNIKVGSKWPSKAWPIQNWEKLGELLKNEFSISRQDQQGEKVLTNLYSYIDWINSCKLLVTNDSLGIHIALALKKKVLVLFGPTSPNEIYFYGRGKAILPETTHSCMPCFKPECFNKENYCMELITPEKVAQEIKNIFL